MSVGLPERWVEIGTPGRELEGVEVGFEGRVVRLFDDRPGGHVYMGPARILEAKIRDGKLRVRLQVTTIIAEMMGEEPKVGEWSVEGWEPFG